MTTKPLLALTALALVAGCGGSLTSPAPATLRQAQGKPAHGDIPVTLPFDSAPAALRSGQAQAQGKPAHGDIPVTLRQAQGDTTSRQSFDSARRFAPSSAQDDIRNALRNNGVIALRNNGVIALRNNGVIALRNNGVILSEATGGSAVEGLRRGRVTLSVSKGDGNVTLSRLALSGVEGKGGSSATPIKHVVFIIQENRSFNNLFMGYPGATTATYGYDARGHKVELHAQSLSSGWDLNHSSEAFFADCDGDAKLRGTHCKMDGWNEKREPNDPPNAGYAYVPRNEIEPYWTMAQQYVLADRMFTSNLDASFVAHQYAVAAYASRSVDGPYADWGCEGGKTDTIATLTDQRTKGKPIVVCFDNPTIAEEADAARVSWRFYASDIYDNGGTWSSYQADREIFEGPDWSADVISPATRFINDVGHGQLAAITWITPPSWESSDHAGLFGHKGPAWVTSLVNAIGTSKFWNSTAIFIMWDDWGGWFDPVPPAYEDYDGLGFRVPLIIISPYARKGHVTHVQYETASVLRFIEDNFGLAQLAASDARANDPANDLDAFDFRQSPRKFSKIAGGKDASYWTRARQTSRPRALSADFGD